MRGKRKKDRQAWFPKHWTEKDIKSAGQYVMSLKRNKKRLNNIYHKGTYKRVKVATTTKNGRISTICPSYTQNGGIKYDIR